MLKAILRTRMTRGNTIVLRGYGQRLVERLHQTIIFKVRLLQMETIIIIIITITEQMIIRVLRAYAIHTYDMRRVPLFLMMLL